MNKTIKLLRKIGVSILGFIVLIFGIILIPAPGPGLLVVIAGLLILSIEFEWAKDYLQKARKHLDSIGDKVKPGKKEQKGSAKDIDRPGNHKRQGKGGNKSLKSH